MKTYTNAFPRGHQWDYTKYKQEEIVVELLSAKERCNKQWNNLLLISMYAPKESEQKDLKGLIDRAITNYVNSLKNLFYWESIDELVGSRGVVGRVSRINFKYESDLDEGLIITKSKINSIIKNLTFLLLSSSNTYSEVLKLRSSFEKAMNDKQFCSLVLSYPK